MLGQPFQQFPGQIQPVVIAIGAFQPHQRAQRLRIVIKAAARGQSGVQRIFPGMAEGRVADVMRQTQRLGQILVQSQRARDHPADLRHFQAVSEPDPVMIAIGRHKHLSLVAQPAKGDGMNDPVAVTLELAARAAAAEAVFGIFASAGTVRIGSEGGAFHVAPVKPSPPVWQWARAAGRAQAAPRIQFAAASA